MSHLSWSAARITAAIVILLNMDVVLSVLLTAGYGLTPSMEAAGTLGLITAAVMARLLPGSDTDLPPGATRLAL